VKCSPVSVRLRIIHHNIFVGLTNTNKRSDRWCTTSSTTYHSLISPSQNCPNNHIGPGHLHTRLKYTIRGVVVVLVSPLLSQPFLRLPLEAKLTLVTISPRIVTIKSNGIWFRLGLRLFTRLLFWFLLSLLLALLPNELVPQVALEHDGIFEIIFW
jgi:hypothetical protein